MKKRVLSIALAFIYMLCLSDSAVFAANVVSDYLPGLTEYYQEITDPSKVSNTTCNYDHIIIDAGGYVKYDYILPFDAATLDIEYYVPEDTTLTLKTPRNTYTAELKTGNSMHQVALAPEHMGVTSVELSAPGKVIILNLKYTKIIADVTDPSRKFTEVLDENGRLTYYNKVVEYSDYQELLKTAVVISEKSTAIKTRNLTRYINLEDTTEATTLVDGKMYLPIGTFARAFGLYYEDYADLMYAYISGNDFAIYLKPGDSYYESKGERKAFTDIALYKNGVTYVPVRELAEKLGYTVYYRDGLAIIDNKISANEILNNYDVFEELKAELAAYEIKPRKPRQRKPVTYHVSQEDFASDNNEGTEEAPFATIQKAADVAIAGDTVIIHEGVYREKVKAMNDGTPSKPIVFKAADGEDVTISAFKTVSGFTPYTNPQNNVSMYVADLSDLAFECALPGAWDVDRNFVLYNDDVLVEGRHPNEKTSTAKTVSRYNESTKKQEQFSYIETPDHNPAYTSTHDHKLLATQGDIRVRDVLVKGSLKRYDHTLYSEIDLNQDAVDYWKGATFIGRVGMGWNLSAGLITASKKNEATVSEKFFTGTGISVGTITYYQAKDAEDYGFLTHHINTVDKAGEWYIDVDAKKMYVIPPSDANPDTMEFEVKERQVCFDMRGKEYVQLQNINTTGGGITMAECVGCILNGGSHKYMSQLDLSAAHCLQGFESIYARYDTIMDDYKYGDDGKNFKKTNLTGEAGLIVTGHYNAVVNTDIEYSAATGIDVHGSYNYIENNFIDKTGYGVTYKGGISVSTGTLDEGFPAGGHQIYQNTVTGSGRAAFNGGGIALAPWDIAYNDFGWANTGATDSGVFYIYGTVGGTDLTPSTIHHNAMHDNVTSDLGSAMSTCLYSDGHTALCNFYNNILYFSDDNQDYIMPDEGGAYRTYEFWQKGTSGAFQRHWTNMTKTFDSPDKVSFGVGDYPNGYPFKAGAVRKSDGKFMLNYNRDNGVRNLANESMSGGSYKTDDGLVAMPSDTSTIYVDDINFGEDGTKIDIYYQGDKYTKDYKNLPTITLELINSNNEVVGKINKPIKKYSAYADEFSHMAVYAPAMYKDCTAVRLSTTARDVAFGKIVISDFNLEEENKKVDMPYNADVILIGSAERMDNIINQYGNPAVIGTSKNEFNIDKDMYLSIGVTSNCGAKYNSRVITDTHNKIKFRLGSNYSNSRGKATVYIGDDTTGEVIAEVSFKDSWKSGEGWSNKTVEADLKRPLEPGTYDFYVKWSGGGTTSFYMAFF